MRSLNDLSKELNMLSADLTKNGGNQYTLTLEELKEWAEIINTTRKVLDVLEAVTGRER